MRTTDKDQNQLELSVTDSKTVTFGALQVTAEFHNESDGFAFRLRCKIAKQDVVGKWTSLYESFAELQVNGREFRLGTGYWGGVFPMEVPFEVLTGKEVA